MDQMRKASMLIAAGQESEVKGKNKKQTTTLDDFEFIHLYSEAMYGKVYIA